MYPFHLVINANKFQSTFRNELTAKKSALGDIKNYFQNSPSQSRADGKLAKEAINAEQLSLFESLNKINADECFDDKFSSESVDYHKVWADKLAMTDEEIDRVLAPGFATYGNDLKPPPSPEPYEGELNINRFSSKNLINHFHSNFQIWLTYRFMNLSHKWEHHHHFHSVKTMKKIKIVV